MERSSLQQRAVALSPLGWAVAFLVCIPLTGCHSIRAALQSGGAESQRLVEQARHAVLAGDLQHADHLLDRADRVSPEDPDVHRQRAQLMEAHGNVPAAIAHLRYAVEREPEDAAGFIHLARLLLEQGRIGEADVAVSSALRLDPEHPDALELKASIAEQRQRPDVALEMYHRLLAADPGDVTARLRIAEIHLNSGAPGRAAPLLRAVIQSPQATQAQQAEAQWSLGIAYGAEARWADAVAALQAAAQDPTRMTADKWYRLAYTRMQAGDFDGARSDLEQALLAQPGHGPATAMQSALDDRVRLQSYTIGTGHSLPRVATGAVWTPPTAGPDVQTSLAVP